MEFFRRQDLLILSSLFLISLAQDMEDLIAVTIPRAIETVSIRAVIETTECSVTCGIGSKVEKRCLVDRFGIHKDCEVVRVECLSNWLCGPQVSTLRVGDPFTMDCQMPPTGILGGRKIYYWRIAPGIISVNDNYFRPLKVWNSTIVFDSIQEKNAGTYRCDVQREDDLKLVKRIYFGIRIITPGIIDINYDKYLISKQKLAALAERLNAQDVLKKLELYGGGYTYVGIGSAVGIVTGLVILVLIRCTCRSKEKDVDTTSVL
ncbi:transmembrane protein 81 [Bufo gargarizans]|uniref:transmembrane protein 81 n=1 Tax=Bufo gargarizans TaxID=30331 RepID=UPI001CF36972|nr:transmembrane protein 81 [Bufo gargarizans]